MKRSEFIKSVALGTAALTVGLPAVAEPTIREYTFFEIMQMPGVVADFYRKEKQDQKSFLWIYIPQKYMMGKFKVKHLPNCTIAHIQRSTQITVEIESVEALKQLSKDFRGDFEYDITNTHNNACRTFLAEVDVMYARLNVDYYRGCSLHNLGTDKNLYHLYMDGDHTHMPQETDGHYTLWRKFYDGFDHAGRFSDKSAGWLAPAPHKWR